MEADFSIRNEVESVRPPNEDKTNYEQYSNYNELKSKFPPFPSTPISGLNQSFNDKYLHQMLGESQEFNKLITLKILDQQNSWKWCAFSLLVILFFCIFKFKTNL